MPILNFSGIDRNEDIFEQLAEISKLLNFLLNGKIDFQNIRARSIKAQNIEVGTLTAEEIAANAITTDKIEAGAVTADKITVDELSAITANLGHIKSGLVETIKMIGSEIYGSYIATAEGTYPRSEMSVTGNWFVSYLNENVFVRISPSFIGSPAIVSEDGVVRGFIATSLPDNYYWLYSTHNIYLNAEGTVDIDDWTKLKNKTSGQTLQDALNNLALNIVNLQSQINSLDARVTALENGGA